MNLQVFLDFQKFPKIMILTRNIKVAESFQESAEILKKTDPAKLIKNQDDLNENIKLINESIKILEKKIDKKKGLIFG